MSRNKPTAEKRFEIRGRAKNSSLLVVDEFSADGSWVARYKGYPMKSGEVQVYTLYPYKGGLTEAGRVRNVRYEKKIINQFDIFAVNTVTVFEL